DELAAFIEQINKARRAVRTLKGIILVDRDHGKPAALRGERISRARGCLFFDEQFFTGILPLGQGYHWWKVHLLLFLLIRCGFGSGLWDFSRAPADRRA